MIHTMQDPIEEINNPFQLEIGYDDTSKTKNNIIETFIRDKQSIYIYIATYNESLIEKDRIPSIEDIKNISAYINRTIEWLEKIENLINKVPYLEEKYNQINTVNNHINVYKYFWDQYTLIEKISQYKLFGKEDNDDVNKFLVRYMPWEINNNNQAISILEKIKSIAVLNYHFYAPSKEKLEDSDQMVVQSLWLLWTSNSKRDDNTAHIADNIYNSTTLQQDEITELRKRFVYLYFIVSKSNIGLIPKETYNMILKELWDDRPQTLYKFQTTDQWNTYMEARHKTSLSHTPSP